MISFICCSIKPNEAESVRKNIEKSVGVPFEFIIFDNRETNFGLCKVYNLCAEKAKYDYLCFIHEDVKFSTLNWGKIIISKLKEEHCGLIGFAGSTIKIDYPTGWFISSDCERSNYIQHYKRKRPSHKYKNPNSLPFSEVITLDGLCIFVSKNIWKEYQFDEQNFIGFHSYDIDFSMNIAQQYINYVCNDISVEHFSVGNYSPEWHKATLQLQEKWEGMLPMGTIDADMSKKNLDEYLRIVKYKKLKYKTKTNLDSKSHFSNIIIYIRSYPKHLLSWRLLEKYLKYKLQYLLGYRKK